jgi:hypothetical protein
MTGRTALFNGSVDRLFDEWLLIVTIEAEILFCIIQKLRELRVVRLMTRLAFASIEWFVQRSHARRCLEVIMACQTDIRELLPQ